MTDVNILIVDDDKDVTECVDVLLSQKNYRVHCINDPTQVIPYLNSNHCHLMVLDLMMPKMHGLEVLKALKADPATADIGVIRCARNTSLSPIRTGTTAVPTRSSPILLTSWPTRTRQGIWRVETAMTAPASRAVRSRTARRSQAILFSMKRRKIKYQLGSLIGRPCTLII